MAVAWSRLGARAVLRSGEALGVLGRKCQQDSLIHPHVLRELERGAQDGSKRFVLSNWEDGRPPAALAKPVRGHHELRVGRVESETPRRASGKVEAPGRVLVWSSGRAFGLKT